MDEKIGVWHAVVGAQPTRLEPESVPFEKHLETWIFEDMSLVSPSLHRIGRQVQIEGKKIDILAIEEPGVWVICEIKKTALYRDSIAQAIDYVTRFDLLGLQDLRKLIGRHTHQQSQEAAALIERAIDREINGEQRDIRVVLAGVGIKEDLSQIVTYLSDKYSFPISVSAYSAIAAPGDDQGFLLLRDISEDSIFESRPENNTQDYESRMNAVRSSFSSDSEKAIFDLLNRNFAQLNYFYIRPWRKSIMIAPKSHHGRYIAYYTANAKGIRAMVSKDSILEFFPDAKVDLISDAETDVYLKSQEEATSWSNQIIESVRNSAESTPSPFREWNGKDWYVAFGADEGRKWSDAIKHNFVSAGGGDWYSRTFKNVPIGARIFVYIPGVGYVGAGVTTGEALPFKESSIFGKKDLVGSYTHSNGEPEYILPVKWSKTLNEDNGFRARGLFASQHSACKLRDQNTLRQLYEKFGVQD